MRSIFVIIAGANIYLMTFAFGRADLGTGRPIMVILLFVISLLWMFEFAMGVKQEIADRRDKTPGAQSEEEQDRFRERLKGSRSANRR